MLIDELNPDYQLYAVFDVGTDLTPGGSAVRDLTLDPALENVYAVTGARVSLGARYQPILTYECVSHLLFWRI